MGKVKARSKEYAICLPDANYFVEQTAIGPKFGGTKLTAKRFLTKAEAYRAMGTRGWSMVYGARVVALKALPKSSE